MMEKSESKSKRVSWSDEETLYLLLLIKERKIMLVMEGKKLRIAEVFRSLEEPMRVAGYNKTGPQMYIKFKNLKCMYIFISGAFELKARRTHTPEANQKLYAKYYPCKRNNDSGHERFLCDFYEELEEILGDRPAFFSNGEDCETFDGIVFEDDNDAKSEVSDGKQYTWSQKQEPEKTRKHLRNVRKRTSNSISSGRKTSSEYSDHTNTEYIEDAHDYESYEAPRQVRVLQQKLRSSKTPESSWTMKEKIDPLENIPDTQSNECSNNENGSFCKYVACALDNMHPDVQAECTSYIFNAVLKFKNDPRNKEYTK